MDLFGNARPVGARAVSSARSGRLDSEKAQITNFALTKFRAVGTMVVVVLVVVALAACDEFSEPKVPIVIGLVTNNPNGTKNVQGFRDKLVALGPINGRDVTFVTPGRPVRGVELERTLNKFVESKVDLIFTAGTPTGVAAYRLTSRSGIPVVFGVIADPIRAGVMADLDRPSGNMTGVMLGYNQARRLELLRQIVPRIKTVAVLYNPNDAAPVGAVAQLYANAPSLNVTLRSHECPNDDAVSAALASISPDVDALFLVPDSVVNRRINDIIAFSIDRRLPVSGPSSAQINQGALMTYGFDHQEVGAQAADIAAQILRGVNPGDVPVQTAEAYLGLNLQTANQIGVDIPRHFLESALVVVRGKIR